MYLYMYIYIHVNIYMGALCVYTLCQRIRGIDTRQYIRIYISIRVRVFVYVYIHTCKYVYGCTLCVYIVSTNTWNRHSTVLGYHTGTCVGDSHCTGWRVGDSHYIYHTIYRMECWKPPLDAKSHLIEWRVGDSFYVG